MFVFISIITLILAILYALLILNFRRGWNKLSAFAPLRLCEKKNARQDAKAQRTQIEQDFDALKLTENQNVTCFSIIISARNEEHNIRDCLFDIINQHYPPHNFEIIVVDDFSEDRTAEVVNQFITDNPGHSIKLLRSADNPLKEPNSFKKAAISYAIENSSFQWIITSDADCRRGNKWLETIASFIEKNDPAMVSAPVCLAGSNRFFEKAQTIEFMGLVGIGAASLALKKPNMCNGANLIYKKDAFYDVKGFEGNDGIASGDDEFLMHKIFKKWPDKVLFLKSHEAIVYTKPEASLSAFIQQRKRWVSKSRKYSNKNITTVLSAAWLFHLMLLICVVLGIFDWKYFVVFIIAFGLKCIAEFTFLSKVSTFFNKRALMGILAPAAFLYIFYVLFIGIYGNFGGYRWKGRKVR